VDLNNPNAIGRIDGADDFEFDDTDYETRGDDVTLDLTTFTIEVWHKPETIGIGGAARVICAKGENVLWWDANWALFTFNTDLYGRIGNGQPNRLMDLIQLDLQVNKWYYIVLTMDSVADLCYLYNNGTVVAQNLTAVTVPYTGGVQNTRIGADFFAPQSYADGIIDEFRISKVARPAAYITAGWQNVNATNFLVWGAEESAAVYLTVNHNTGMSQVFANGTLMANGTQKSYNSGENINVTSFPNIATTNQFFKHTYDENGIITESLYNPYIDDITINSTIFCYVIRHPSGGGGGLPLTLLLFVILIPMGLIAWSILSKRR